MAIRNISLLEKYRLLHKCWGKLKNIWTKSVDQMLNIDTVSLPKKAINRNTKFHDDFVYEGASYLQLWKYMNSIGPLNGHIVFDIGCGMGRMLCLFARKAVKKCVGVEVSKELAEKARENAMRLRGRKAPIQIVVGDAAEADYSEGTIYLLFNPFGTKTLQVVLERIHESLRHKPRQIRIAYFNPLYEDVFRSCEWLKCYKRKKSALTGETQASFWTNDNFLLSELLTVTKP